MITYAISGLCLAVSGRRFISLQDLLDQVFKYHGSSYRGYSNGIVRLRGRYETVTSLLQVKVYLTDCRQKENKPLLLDMCDALNKALEGNKYFCLCRLEGELRQESAIKYRGAFITDSGLYIPFSKMVYYHDKEHNASIFYKNRWRPANIVTLDKERYIEALTIAPDLKTGKVKQFRLSEHEYLDFN